MIEQLIEKNNGERTFFDGELVGAYFTIANLEKFAKAYHNEICSDLDIEGWLSYKPLRNGSYYPILSIEKPKPIGVINITALCAYKELS